jgi:uncharacterized membrane protein YgcG
MGYDTRCLSSDVLSLAVAGKLRIHRQDRFLLGDVWRLERERSATEVEVRGSQSVLFGGLFSGARETLTLKKSNAQTLAAAQTAHKKALDGELHPRYFKRNGLSLALAGGIAAVTSVGAFLVSGGYGIPAVVLLTGVMGGVVLVFSRLIRAPTPEGRRLLDEIEGLVLYLGVAERDELAGLTGPDGPPALDAERYEALLPYAVALEVEDAWTDKFTAAVGTAEAAATASRMSWYSGRGSISDMGSFSKAMGSGLSSQISAASSPPGSSSGSGGGGSSGGGGGGGGGGGR